MKALEVLGVNKIIALNIPTNQIENKRDFIYSYLAKLSSKFSYDYVFSHWFGDAHRDHRELSKICMSILER